MSATAYHPSSPSIGEKLRGLRAGRHMERTETPVWRNSHDVEDERALRYPHAFDPEEMGPIMAEVEKYNLETKGPGKRCGELLTHGVPVMRHLIREAIKNKGLCCPSHKQIAAALNIAESTAKATLNALRNAGFLEWMRRTIIDDSGDGPRRKQTSNLYRFVLPKALAWRVSKRMLKKGRKPGLPRSIAAALSPADIAARRTQYDRDRTQMQRKSRPLCDRIALLIQDPCPSPLSTLS